MRTETILGIDRYAVFEFLYRLNSAIALEVPGWRFDIARFNYRVEKLESGERRVIIRPLEWPEWPEDSLIVCLFRKTTDGWQPYCGTILAFHLEDPLGHFDSFRRPFAVEPTTSFVRME